MSRPPPHNQVSSSASYPPRPSRIPRLCSNGTPSASKLGPDDQFSSFGFLTVSTPTYHSIKTDASLAAKLRAKLHAISPRRPIDTSSRISSQGISQVLESADEDLSSGLSTEIFNTTFPETDQDQDFHSQSTTLIENESPCVPLTFLLSYEERTGATTPSIRSIETTPEKRKKKLLKHPFRVDKLRLFLNRTRIGWSSTIPMLQMSPRVIILDISVQDKKMAITFAVREDISTTKPHDGGKEKMDGIAAVGSTIGEKLRRAKVIALDQSTDEEKKILALEEVLNEVALRGGELEDWLLDEMEDVSTIYGELLGIDDVDLRIGEIMDQDKMKQQELDNPEDLWLFDEERVCVGLKGVNWSDLRDKLKIESQ
ncbi:hypothetical protein TWF718_009018 [Orbilia javanica]|uniref:Uncharacterized protein n=1 Tax=Orbilia javanica TaxID=47235 RepID=A0AAN8RC97_9PEZI